MPVVIESGIPMPGEPDAKRIKNIPWGKMKVGDSFFHPNFNSARAGIFAQTAKLGFEFRMELVLLEPLQNAPCVIAHGIEEIDEVGRVSLVEFFYLLSREK